MPNEKPKPVALILALLAMLGGLAVLVPAGSQTRDSRGLHVFSPVPVETQQSARQTKPKKQPAVTVTIRPLVDEVRFGDPIPVEFTIRNVGRKAYEYLDRDYDRSGRLWVYQLVVETETGKTLPDPQVFEMLGGELYGTKKLPPGGQFTKTVVLNQWAIIKEHGKYRVTGIYNLWLAKAGQKPAVPILSKPVTIDVRPRTENEMRVHIRELQRELDNVAKPEERGAILERLAYTCSPEILQILLKTWYEADGGFWEVQALSLYVPRSEAIKRQIVDVAAQRGLADGMQSVLGRYQVTAEEMFPLIERSLAEDNPSAWAAGALAAQIYSNDAFTTRLAALATDPRGAARLQAIHALALNRTNESVRVLKELLDGPDEAIRKRAADAIRAAYLYRGISQGRPLLKTDFDERLQRRE